MQRTRTVVQQPVSGQVTVARRGIQHLDVVNAQIVVGVTPAKPAKDKVPAREQAVHLCSLRIVDPVCERQGDGKPVPINEAYPVVISGGLPEVPTSGFIRFRATICANGSLSFKQRTRKARFVPTPQCMQALVPHAHEWGPADMASAYGCTSVEQMFEKHGCDLVS
jgi:hypothetical protein